MSEPAYAPSEPPYQPPPWAAQPPSTKKRKTWLIVVVVATVGLMLLILRQEISKVPHRSERPVNGVFAQHQLRGRLGGKDLVPGGLFVIERQDVTSLARN